MIEETVLLNFEIDQGQAEKELVKTNKAILQNKEAQQELNKAYKEGAISQDEYVHENIRLQQNLKKNQDQSKALNKLIDTESNSRNAVKNRVAALVKEYDNLNLTTAHGIKRQKELEKELLSLNSTITKTSKSAGLFKDQIGNYPDSFKNAAQSINVAGVSVGDVGAKLAAFANPATAAIGIVSALGAAYARSTVGAKDLEFAQNTLSASITFTTNRFAELISSAEDGQGILSKLTDLFVGGVFGIGTLVDSKLTALNIEKLEDLEREEIGLRDKINERLETNQELLTAIQDEQTLVNDKIHNADNIVDNLRANESELLDIKQKQLEIIQFQLRLNENDETVQTQILEKQREISNIERDTEKKVQAILRLKDNINDAEQKRLALLAQQKALDDDINKRLAGPSSPLSEVVSLADPVKLQRDKANEERTQQLIDGAKLEVDTASRLAADLIKINKAYHDKVVAETKAAEEAKAKARIQNEIAYLNAASGIAASLSQLAQEGSEEQKSLALAGIAVDTASAIAGGVASSQDIPYPGNLVAMATTIATILANIAEAKSIIDSGYAEGGYTGAGGKYQPAGIVHKGEYVVPSHIVNNPAYAGNIGQLEHGRLKGYADGGFVARQLAAPTQTAMLSRSGIAPAPVVSVVEINRVQKAISVKENLARL